MLSSWYKKFSSQPHQPFFASGMVLFILYGTLICCLFSGTLSLDATIVQLHAYPMIFIVFIQFFLGFLFVVFPRFLMQAVIPAEVYMRHFFLFFGGSLLYTVGLLLFTPLLVAATILLLAAQVNAFVLLLSIYRKSIVKDKTDTRWVLVAFASGIVANVCAVLFSVGLQVPLLERAATSGGFYLFLFLLIFTISQRMIPHFTEVKVTDYRVNKTPRLLETLFALLLVKVLFQLLQRPEYEFVADIPLLLLFVREFAKWRLPVTKVPPIIWILYLSLLWIPLGFLLSAVHSLAELAGTSFLFEKASLHALAVGYFLTILIGFGTRVVLGHSGRVPTADRGTVALIFFIQIVALSRIVAAFSTNFGGYDTWIALSAAMMVAALLAWSIRYFKILAISF
ncbi:NnrS family protein [Hydrogenimonas sp.]